MKLLEENTLERNKILETHLEDQKKKIKQLKEDSRKYTRLSREEQERQSNLNLEERAQQTRQRFETLRQGIIEGHHRLQAALPLLMLLNQSGGTGGGRLNGMIHSALMTLTRFSDAANVKLISDN